MSIDLWQRAHPVRPAARNEAAVHQAGYAVASEAEGLRVQGAEIHPQQGGWAGSVNASFGVDYYSCIPPSQSDGLRADAVTTLAGPAAVAILAGGDFLSLPIEIMMVASMVTGVAEIEGKTFAVALRAVTARTARILRFHRNGILALADHLARHGYASGSEPATAQVLETARAIVSRALPSAPRHEKELARLIASAPVDLAALGQGVARLAQDGA